MVKLKNKTITSYKVVQPKKVQGAKAGSKPSQSNIADDTVASLSLAKILYGLGEGEISGIVDGGKGIKLEDTPLLDDNGKANFDNVTWDFRSGTLEQDYIKGFPDVSNEIPVSVELKSSTAWIKAINKPELSAVRIRLAWNGLKKQELKSGDVNGYKIEYAIDVKTGSGSYVEVLKTFINDKVSGKYERTHRIDLPESVNGWQIRVRRLTANANSELIQDRMYIESITEVIDVKLRYPNTALLGLQYDAKTFSRIAKIAVRAKGKIISIPSNYDTNTGLYTGLWNGTFKQAYSNNPAWIFYDVVTNSRYGLGKRIDKSMIDKWSLYSLGVYCDELIDDGTGTNTKEKRYTCNVYIQSQQDAFKFLQQISGIFKALTYWNGEQIVLDADVPQDPVYTFTRANVIDGNFEYTGTRLRDRHTVAKVAFDNPNEGFKTEYEYIRDEKGIAKYGINIVDISALGCTSRGQAQRAGLWALKSEQLETRTVSFRTGLEGFIPQVGNIVEVSDELLAGRVNGGRIAKVQDKVITLDRTLPISIDDIIVVNGSNGISEKRKVINVNDKVITVVTAFENVVEGAVFAIRAKDLDTMKFRVMTIKPDDNNVFSISAIQHEPLKYDAIDFGADVKPTNISTIKPTTVSAPDNVSVSATYKVVQGQTVATMVIQWSQVKDAVAYHVEWRKDNGNWIKAPVTGNVSLEVEGVYAGNYLAKVVAVDAFDVSSLATTSNLTEIKGKVGKPNSLASIKATGVLFGMLVEWFYKSGSEDTAYTEIEVATDATGANSSLLGSFSYPTNNTTINGLQGGLTLHYRGRLVDKLGNVSDWSQWAAGTTDNSADKLLDQLEGQITEQQLFTDLGTKINQIDINKSGLENLGLDLESTNNKLTIAEEELEKQKQNLIDDIKDLSDTIDIKEEALIESVNSTNDALVEEARLRLLGDKAALTGIREERETRESETGLLTTQFKGLYAQTNPTMIGDSTGLIGSVEAFTGVWTETSARIEGDLATSKKIDGLTATVNKNNASILETYEVLATKTEASATKTTSLSARLLGDYEGDNLSGVKSGLLYQEQSARVNADNAITQQISLISAGVGEQFDPYKMWAFDENTEGWYKVSYASGWVKPTAYPIKSPTGLTITGTKYNYLKMRIKKVGSPVWGGSIKYGTTTKTIPDPTFNLDNIGLVNFNIEWLGVISSFEINLTGAVNSSNYYLIDWIAVGRPSPSASYAALYDESVARSTEDEAIGRRITKITGELEGDISEVLRESEAATNKAESTAKDLLALKSTYAGNLGTLSADLVSEVNTRSNEHLATSTKLDGVFAQINPTMIGNSTGLIGNNTVRTGVWSETSARIEEDLALSIKSDNLFSEIKDNKATISNNYKTLVTKTESIASSVSSLSSEYGSNKGTIRNELTSITNDATALSKKVTTVESVSGKNKSSIETQSKTIDGLSSEWSMKLDVNGYVSGVGQYNNGKTSQFAVRVDQFYIADPNSKTASTPFQVTGGKTVIKDAYIRDASIDLAKIKTASITRLDSLSANIGHFKSASTGARLEIKDSLLSVYDSNNRLRVRLGLW